MPSTGTCCTSAGASSDCSASKRALNPTCGGQGRVGTVAVPEFIWKGFDSGRPPNVASRFKGLQGFYLALSIQDTMR